MALAAAVATIWILVHQIQETDKARQNAQEERRMAAEDRELARQERLDVDATQARAVVVGNFFAGLLTGAPVNLFNIRAVIWNYSQEPILNVHLATETEEGDYWKLWFAPLIGPNSETPVKVTLRPAGDWPVPRIALLSGTLISIYFTDSNGRRWRRCAGGSPQRDVPGTPVLNFADVKELEGSS